MRARRLRSGLSLFSAGGLVYPGNPTRATFRLKADPGPELRGFRRALTSTAEGYRATVANAWRRAAPAIAKAPAAQVNAYVLPADVAARRAARAAN